MPPPIRPLIVRLRNWVGDVTLGLPMLQRLADAGYDLRLVGKGWARELLAGHGWTVEPLPGGTRERIAQLRRLRSAARSDDSGFGRRLNALCLPYSFSSALEFRLAGLRTLGHAYEGRSLLLARAVPRLQGAHELAVYWQLGSALLGADAPLPERIGLRVADRHRERAAAFGLQPGYVVICPFAGGTWSGEDKTWPAFAGFAADVLPRFGRQVVICPGPGEETIAETQFPGATRLDRVDLGTYAALLQDAALMISNDTGPGHIAAAVGAPLLSVLGPSDPAQWGAWGPTVTVAKGRDGGWPSADEVKAAVERLLG